MNLKINTQNQVRIECLEYITYFTYSCTHIILPQVPLYLFFLYSLPTDKTLYCTVAPD